MTMTVERAQIAPLMLGDIFHTKGPNAGTTIPKFTDAEAAVAMEAAAIRLNVKLDPEQKALIRAAHGREQ